jgi:hypothetical protein
VQAARTLQLTSMVPGVSIPAEVSVESMLRLPPDASGTSQLRRVYAESRKPAPRTAAAIKRVCVGYQNKSQRHHMDSNLQVLGSHQEPVDITAG